MHVESTTDIEELARNFEGLDRSSHEIVQGLLDIDARSRRSLFPWRGQFSPQLIEFLISEYHSPKAACHLFDPFCGSGTVLAEAARHHISATGFDINPAAFLFASMHMFANQSFAVRLKVIAEVRDYLCPSSLSLFGAPQTFHPSETILRLHGLERSLFAASLMLSMKDQKEYSLAKHEAAFRGVAKTILAMPESEASLVAEAKDSRTTGLNDQSVDLIITSPPYINVFNYHQNYRPALELMGWRPLSIAVAEIGANRKHRQNRFLTVVQYCIDLSLTLCELRRILKSNGSIVFVVGRSSNVRGVAFSNGLLLGLIANLSGTQIANWRERRFLNRFGEDIYEDILTFQPFAHSMSEENAVAVGRRIGLWALKRALTNSIGEVRDDLSSAIEKAPSIMPSPTVNITSPSVQPNRQLASWKETISV